MTSAFVDERRRTSRKLQNTAGTSRENRWTRWEMPTLISCRRRGHPIPITGDGRSPTFLTCRRRRGGCADSLYNQPAGNRESASRCFIAGRGTSVTVLGNLTLHLARVGGMPKPRDAKKCRQAMPTSRLNPSNRSSARSSSDSRASGSPVELRLLMRLRVCLQVKWSRFRGWCA